jgi:transposase
VASIVAALDVHTGQVSAEQVARNDADHFIEFLAGIDQETDPALAVHLILDNGSSHVAKKTKAWLADHPRFHVHHTPKHASWLNQVEPWPYPASRSLQMTFMLFPRGCTSAVAGARRGCHAGHRR